MDQIPLGQFIGIITGAVAGLVAFIKGVQYLKGEIDKKVTRWISNGLAPIHKKLDEIDCKLTEVDVSASKNFLVRFLVDVEQGNEVDEIEKERFCETYRHYRDDLHKNTYIHSKVEKLKKEGKL